MQHVKCFERFLNPGLNIIVKVFNEENVLKFAPQDRNRCKELMGYVYGYILFLSEKLVNIIHQRTECFIKLYKIGCIGPDRSHIEKSGIRNQFQLVPDLLQGIENDPCILIIGDKVY